MNERAGDRREIGVFLLDDHEIVRREVKELLEAEPDIKVVGEAGTAAAALAGFRRCGPTWRCSTSGCPMATASA